jgi:hypothetical protein
MKRANGQVKLYLVLSVLVFSNVILQASESVSFQNVSNNPGASLFPALAVVQNRVHIVWDDDTSGNSEILYAQSTDGGKSFSSPRKLSNNSGKSRNATIAASGNRVYVFWDDDTPGNAEIFYTVSQDGGQTFSAPLNLSQNTGRSILPKIALSSQGILHVVWQDDTPGNREILYAQSADGSRTFTPARNISQNAGRSLSPVIAVANANVYIAWDDATPGNHEIFYVHSSDGGLSFSNTTNLSQSLSFSAAPAIAAFENQVHVTWTEEVTPENYEVLYSQSSEGGIRFGAVQNASRSPTYSGASVIGASEAGVYLMWIEGLLTQKNGKPYVDYEALYAQWLGDDGFATPQNISASEGATVNPALVISGGQFYTAFADETPGNFEIFVNILLPEAATAIHSLRARSGSL